jgi:hypothetical protein
MSVKSPVTSPSNDLLSCLQISDVHLSDLRSGVIMNVDHQNRDGKLKYAIL